MAFVIADRVRETTTSFGTGSVTLAGAYTSFQTFSSAIGNGNNTYYTIASATSGEWEVGIGTYSLAGNSLSRDTVLASSASGAKVGFSVGTKDVFVTQPAERSLLINSTSNGLFGGGTAFTNNGVAYANSTSTLATGSALTFDGTNFATTGGIGATGATGITNTVGGNTARMVATAVATYFGSTNAADVVFQYNSNEGMRLTSTGLGIGTNSPLLTAAGRGNVTINGGTDAVLVFGNAAATAGYLYAATTKLELDAGGSRWIQFNTGGNERMRLDASGNLGLGVPPSAWGSGIKSYQVGNYTALTNNQGGYTWLSNNAFYDTAWKYLTTNRALYYAQDTSTGAHAWYNAPSGTAGNAITFTQAMTLDASGSLGVGETSPSSYSKFVVANSTASLAFFYRQSSAGLSIGADNDGPYLSTSTYHNLRFFTNAAERARIDSSGNFWIAATSLSSDSLNANGFRFGSGTFKQQYSGGFDFQQYYTAAGQASPQASIFVDTAAWGVKIAASEQMRLTSTGLGVGVASPNAKLDVYSSSTTAGTPIAFFGKALNSNATSNVLVQFLINSGGTGSGQINANGASAAAFGTYSDARLKENIVDLPPQLSNICALRPVEFDYKDGSGHQIGFVAQEMQAVYPDVVGSDNDEMLTVTGWSKTEARLVKAIQELKAEFDAYKATHP